MKIFVGFVFICIAYLIGYAVQSLLVAIKAGAFLVLAVVTAILILSFAALAHLNRVCRY